MAAPKIYGNVKSTATRQVLVCLHEKGLEYEFVPVNMATGDHETDPFLSCSPLGQVPAFEDGDLKLFAAGVMAHFSVHQSELSIWWARSNAKAINQYLANAYAWKGTDLIFSDPKKMATAAVWMEVEAATSTRWRRACCWSWCTSRRAG